MKKYCLTLLFLLLLGTAQAKNLGCGVETIPEAKIVYGCGCGYWAETKPILMPILQSDFGFEDARMFIDGKLVEVVPHIIEGIPKKPKIGNGFSQTFRYQNAMITFQNTVSFICPPASEGCEVLSFDTKLLINRMQCNSTHEITGDCGC